jgi:hypothetical protein
MLVSSLDLKLRLRLAALGDEISGTPCKEIGRVKFNWNCLQQGINKSPLRD